MGEVVGSNGTTAGAPSSGGRRWLVWVAVAVVVVLVAGVVVVVASRGSSASAAVRLVPARSAGEDPFSASVQVVAVSSFPGNVEAIAATTRKSFPTQDGVLVASGTKPGLYGGSGDVHVCDPAKLVDFLAGNPAKATAWASVLGISTSQIKSYVAGLTPVVLVQDTVVGNHGYRHGRATYETSVLQAGTSVMVDSSGVPRVKCNCGNPLTSPQVLSPAHTTGTPWTGYDPTHVTSVSPGAPRPGGLTGIDINTGIPITLAPPSGSGGGGSGRSGDEWVAIVSPSATTSLGYSESEVVTSTDGTTWRTAGIIPGPHASAIAYGDGRWLAMAPISGTPSTAVFASTDLNHWSQVATIGNDETALGYGNGTWVAVGQVNYMSSDGITWTSTDLDDPSPGVTPAGVVYGGGQWLTAWTSEAIDVREMATSTELFISSNGQHWVPGAPIDGIAGRAAAYGDGRWVLAGWPDTQSNNAVYTSADGSTWTPGASLAGNDGGAVALAYGGGSWLLMAAPSEPGRDQIFSSRDGRTWHQIATSEPFTVLAYGPVGPGSSPDSTTTTTASSSCPTSDQLMHDFDDETFVPTSFQDIRCADGYALAEEIDRDTTTAYFVFKGSNADGWSTSIHYESAAQACAIAIPANVQAALGCN